MERHELHELGARFDELDSLEELKFGTPECDEYLKLRKQLNAPQPVYLTCDYCGKEDHQGWANDPRVSTLTYTRHCSEECHDKRAEANRAWLEEITGRTVDDFPIYLDAAAYTEMSIWAASIMLQDPERREALEEAHPLYRSPEFLARQIRMYSLDAVDREYVEFPDRNSFLFTKPVPREMALKSFGITKGGE